MAEGITQRILVIDDEQDICDVLALTLKDSGYQVITAFDGPTGLERCREFEPQIVITDIRMPQMDGLAVLETLKARKPDVEVIVATAFGDMELAVRALQLGASDFITKPIGDAALQVAIQRAQQRISSRRQILEKQVADQTRALHQDKIISLGRLAASVAHEINNPLSAVLNYIRLMTRMMSQQGLDEQQRLKFQGYLEVVEKEVARCSRIVAGLLTFARKAPPTRQPVNLKELIERSLLLSHHRLELGNIDLTSDIDSNLPHIQGDAGQLEQCLINLIFNAIDAMPDGGRLRVDAQANAEGSKIIIKISDSGHGIDSQDLPHIFEPFFTTRKEGHGTGLGLSTTYGIVQAHNGSIDVHTQKGKGSVFTLQLPTQGS
jgi:signal transduction histidine kinase